MTILHFTVAPWFPTDIQIAPGLVVKKDGGLRIDDGDVPDDVLIRVSRGFNQIWIDNADLASRTGDERWRQHLPTCPDANGDLPPATQTMMPPSPRVAQVIPGAPPAPGHVIGDRQRA